MVIISGDIGIVHNNHKYILNSMANLSVCNIAGLHSSAHWCYEMRELNYYSEILFTVEDPILPLKLWLQTTKSYGKIEGTELFVVLDCRLPEAGISLQHDLIGSVVMFEAILCSLCNVTLDDEIHPLEQLLLFPNKQSDIFELKNLTCRKNETIIFNSLMTSSYSFQRSTNAFCRKHLFTDRNCLIFISELSQDLMIRKHSRFPPVQTFPSPLNPFVFVHIEKTGGTTLRE